MNLFFPSSTILLLRTRSKQECTSVRHSFHSVSLHSLLGLANHSSEYRPASLQKKQTRMHGFHFVQANNHSSTVPVGVERAISSPHAFMVKK